MNRWLVTFFLFILVILKTIFAIPSVSFVSPTPIGNISENYIYVNLSTSGAEHYSFVDFDNDLIGWWRMDNRNSTYVFDESSNGLNAEILNGTTFSSGKYGNASDGDGVNNYLRVQDGSAFNAIANNDEMTVCAWVYRRSNSNAYGASQGILGQYWASGIHNYLNKSFAMAEGITAPDGGYGFYVSPDGSSWQDAFTNSAVPLNTWHHLCGVVESSGTVKLYLDGVVQTNTGSVAGIFNAQNTPFTIGTYYYAPVGQGDSSLFFNGSVDEVLLFSRGLSQAEVRAIYNSTAYASFAHNYTELSNGSHTFKGYGVDEGVDFVSRTVYTGVIEEENDTTNPAIEFVSPTEDDESNLSRDYIQVNASASDDNLANITIYLYDDDSLVDFETGTNEYKFSNFTGLDNGTYYFNATAYDSYGNSNLTLTRSVIVAYSPESNETNETTLLEINITCSNIQINDFNLTLTTNANADSCWFDGSLSNVMTAINSTSFYYDSIGAGLYNLTFYCNNSNGTANLSDNFEFRKYANFYDSHFTNSQGLEIYFDLNYNYTADEGILLITSDTWSSDKDSSTLVDAENKYMPRGYAVASVETRGKGSSQGTPDAYGYDCIDIHELAEYIFSNPTYSQYVNESRGVYLVGASGAGGRTGVCTAKYPDYFVSGHTSVGVLNLTLWWLTAAQSDVTVIEQRVGCDPNECPEAYLARDAGYLSYNTQTPMSVEHPIDDTRVTVNCSRNYKDALALFNKTYNYTEPSSGGHRGDWSQSYNWFTLYTEIPSLPSSGDLRIGGFVKTKNFSIFLDETTVNHMAYVNYDISGENKLFNLTTQSFDGNVNFTVFDLTPDTNYTLNSSNYCHESDSNGDLFFVLDVDSYNLELINVSIADNCTIEGQGNESNETNETYANLTINFVSPTPSGQITEDYIYVNTSSNGTEHYSFVKFDSDLVGWWRIENDSFIDSSGNGNNGVAVNGSSITNGKYGNAFNGGNQRFVAVPDSSSLDSLSVTDKMTVCSWIYPFSNGNPWGSYQAVLGQYMTTGNKKSFGILEGLAGTGKYAFYLSADGSAWQDAQSNSALSLNTWHHICGTMDGSTIRLYVNGDLQTDTGTVSGIYNTNVNFTIGYYYTSSVFYNGNIDEVLLYNRALSLNEIRAIYNSSQYASFANNYTSLADGNHNFKAYAVNGTDIVSEERTVETGYVESPTNNAPTTDLVIVNSSNGNNYTTENLVCYAQASDLDEDNLSYSGYWYKNGVQDLAISSSVSVLESGNTSVDDVWRCEVRAFDGENYSNYLSSNNLTVLNEPVQDNPAVIYMNSPSFIVTFDANISDDNGISNVSLMGNWSIGGWQEDQTNSSGANNSNYSFSRLFNSPGTYLWAFKVYDSAGQITNSENKTIILEFI